MFISICSSLAKEPVDHTVDQALTFIQDQLDKMVVEPRPIRGPHLAKLELLKCLVERKSEEASKIGENEGILLKVSSEYF